MTESVSEYVDHVVEEVLTAYATARDEWFGDRSAVLAIRIREVLRGERVDLSATERGLDDRFDQYHLGLVLWVDASDEPGTLPRIRHLVSGVGQAVGLAAAPLVVPADENSAWAWLPTKASLARTGELALAAKSEPAVALAVGEPAAGIDGFRRTHRQAVSARAVALAAGDERAPITPFVDVAPIAMLCADLGSGPQNRRSQGPSFARWSAGCRTGPARVLLAEGGRAATEPLISTASDRGSRVGWLD